MCPDPLDDGHDDRESEPGPGLAVAQHAVEGLEDAVSFGGRYARAGIRHGQHNRARLCGHAEIDRSAFRRVAHGVVRQVADQCHHIEFAHGNFGVFLARHPDVDVFGLGQWQYGFQYIVEDVLDPWPRPRL